MLSVSFDKTEDEYSLVIDGEEYIEAHDEGAIIPKAILEKIKIEDIPEDLKIEVCDAKDSSAIVISIPASFKKIGKNEFEIYYNELISRKYWDGPVGLKHYMETKKEIIEERSEEVKDVWLDNYDDDGNYIDLTYHSKIITDDMTELLNDMQQLFDEIDGATDISLGSPFARINDCEKESDFTIKVLLPLFRKLGFVNVKYNHGNKEFGKDVTFARRTEFDSYEYYGVQVKYGNVSGGASGEINELIQQAKDCYAMPFYDVYSREKIRVSKVIIAISGKFTNNAVEKIVDGISDYPMKNNMIFLDGELIEGLASKYSRF